MCCALPADDDEDEDEEDEEGEREAWLLRIEAASLKAVDNLKLLQQEAQLLVRPLAAHPSRFSAYLRVSIFASQSAVPLVPA